ncbi:MAG TPA: hypothetical protein VG733_09915 [Chthoniobacteraceae bacterium]|nr:hypothetical protein [Chthoniobacteraceae bacterium]
MNRLALVLVVCAGFHLTASGADPADPRFASDKPRMKYLFVHTPEKPYDIKALQWYGGIMERIVVVDKSTKPIVVDFRLTKLSNGIVAVPARAMEVAKRCLPGANTVMMDLLSSDGDTPLSYAFDHFLAQTGDALETRARVRLASQNP